MSKLIQVHGIRNGEVRYMEQFEYTDRDDFMARLKRARADALERGPWDDLRVVEFGSPEFLLSASEANHEH